METNKKTEGDFGLVYYLNFLMMVFISSSFLFKSSSLSASAKSLK